MFDIAQFEDAGRDNGMRYWLAHDFMQTLGYSTWSSFRKVIQRAQTSCLQLGIDVDDAFIRHSLGDGTRSYKLTRFACYLIAMQADAKKPEVAAAQVVLAKIAEALVEERISDNSLARLEERGKLTEAEKQLGSSAKAAGLTGSREHAIFRDAGFRGMYNMPLRSLKKIKGAPDNKTLYDYMGLTELAANTFRVTQTSERLRRNHARGLQQAKETASEVGQEVRHIMIRSSGVRPEELELEGPISKVRSQIKATNRKMRKLDAVKKKVTKKKAAKKKAAKKKPAGK